MARWKETDQRAWENERARGQARYLLVKGVLAWGLPMFVLMAGGPALFGFPYSVEGAPSWWGWQALLWATCGVMYGLLTWTAKEKRYGAYRRGPSS